MKKREIEEQGTCKHEWETIERYKTFYKSVGNLFQNFKFYQRILSESLKIKLNGLIFQNFKNSQVIFIMNLKIE